MSCNIVENTNKKCNMKTNKNKNNSPHTIYKNLFDNENGVTELVLSDFDIKGKKIKMKNKKFSRGNGFVLFYAPWCSHCKNFKQEYENIALDYIQNFPFGAVNVENVRDGNDRLRHLAGIDGVPTLKYIDENGLLHDFQSNINNDDIIYFINMNF